MSSPENTQELPEPLPGGSNTSQKATTPSCLELRSPSGNAVFRMDWGGGGSLKKSSASAGSATKTPLNGANGRASVVAKSESTATTPLVIDDSVGESWLSAKANRKAAASGSPPVGKLKIRMKNIRREKTTAKFVKSPTKALKVAAPSAPKVAAPSAPKAAAPSTPASSKTTATPKQITPPAKRCDSPRKTAQASVTTPKKSRDSVAEKLAKARRDDGSTSEEKPKKTRRKSKPVPRMVLNGETKDQIPSASKSAAQKAQKPVAGKEPPGTPAAAGRLARINSSSSSMNGRSPSPSKKAIGLITPTGYEMKHLSASAKKRYWACIYRRAGDDPLCCHGTASSDLNCGEVKEWKEHNHPPGVAPDGSVAEDAVPPANGVASDVADKNGGSVAQAQNGSPKAVPKPASSRTPDPKPHTRTSSIASTPNARGAQQPDAPEEDDDGTGWDDDYLPEIPVETPMCNGYEMKADSAKSRTKQYYHCPKRKQYGCRGRAQSKVGSRYLQETIGHNHNPGQPPLELMSSTPAAAPAPSTSTVAEKTGSTRSTNDTPTENGTHIARKRGRPPKNPSKTGGKGKNKENEEATPKDRKRRSDAKTPATPVKKSKKAVKERERAAMPGKVLLEILGGLDRNSLEALQLTCRGFKQYVDRGGSKLHFRRVESAKLSPKGAVMQLATEERNDGGGQKKELRSELTLKTDLAAWFFKSLRHCVVERMEITGIAVTDSFVQALVDYAPAVHVRHLQYTVTASDSVQLSGLFEHFWYVHTIDFRGSRSLLSLVKDATLYKFCEKEFLRMILPRTSPQCKVTDVSEDALLDFVFGESDEGKTVPLTRTFDVQSPKITSHFIQRLAKFHRDASAAPQPVSLNVQFPVESQDIQTPFAIPAHKTEHKSGYTLHFDGGLRVVWSHNQRCLRISRGAENEKKEASP